MLYHIKNIKETINRTTLPPEQAERISLTLSKTPSENFAEEKERLINDISRAMYNCAIKNKFSIIDTYARSLLRIGKMNSMHMNAAKAMLNLNLGDPKKTIFYLHEELESYPENDDARFALSNFLKNINSQ